MLKARFLYLDVVRERDGPQKGSEGQVFKFRLVVTRCRDKLASVEALPGSLWLDRLQMAG
jgi:hypothetical protein